MAADESPLGKPTDYPDRYDPSLLFAIPRAAQRASLGLGDVLPFDGADLWTAYEITWLEPGGKPALAVGYFRVPADSPCLVESKSLKLYLGSFAQEPLAGRDEAAARIAADLERACGAAVGVRLLPVEEVTGYRVDSAPGESLDEIASSVEVYVPEPAFLVAGGASVEETLHSALFRSRCPVTGQPDYADVMIRYRGPRIDRTGLLRYLVSYRRHAAFHEACVERMFVELSERCATSKLSVYARFLRRGGVDINPFRSNFEPPPSDFERSARQ